MRHSWVLLITLLAGCSASDPAPPATPAGAGAPTPSPAAAISEPAAAAGQPLPLPKADRDTVIFCTGATLKMGDMALWKKWVAESGRRYKEIYPDKSSADLESYTLERALDKRRELERRGINSPRAFTQYYNSNCLGILE